MSIGKTVSIKISNFDLLTTEFEEIIKKINKKNNLNLKENILEYAWGYQDEDNLRINFSYSKQKIEFVAIYEKEQELEKYIEMIKSFINYTEVDFKFIAISFGLVYVDIPNINYKFIVPEFKDNGTIKYKISTDIHNIENGNIYLSSNFHFYDFLKLNKKPKETIIKDILGNFDNYYNIFKSMTGLINE